MRKIYMLLLFLLPVMAFSQQTEGVILFKETIKFDFEGRGGEHSERWKEMMKNMPKEQSIKKQLFFNASETFFTAYEDPDAEVNPEEMRGPMRWMMMRAQEDAYTNIDEQRMTQQREMFGKTFLVKDSLRQINWKISAEQKVILDYPCMKATGMIDTNEVVVWFAPTLPVSAGPEGVGGLPGMILEGSLRDGMMLVVAEKIELRELKEDEIREPSKGKEVTQEEFNEIRREKMQEMREMRGKGGWGH